MSMAYIVCTIKIRRHFRQLIRHLLFVVKDNENDTISFCFYHYVKMVSKAGFHMNQASIMNTGLKII